MDSYKPFVPHDVLDDTAKAGAIGLATGVFIAAAQNALAKRNVGAMAVFTQRAPIIGICSAAPAAYVFSSRAMMNLHEKDDSWAEACGGFVGGAVLGLPTRRLPVVMGLGGSLAVVQGTLHFLGGRIDSFKSEEDEFERKEKIRRTTRIPVEQTIVEVGEGRGIRPPGYEERRRERIKAKYGFDINPVKVTVDGSQ